MLPLPGARGAQRILLASLMSLAIKNSLLKDGISEGVINLLVLIAALKG